MTKNVQKADNEINQLNIKCTNQCWGLVKNHELCMVLSLLNTIEKDTLDHSIRVNQLAIKFGRFLKISDNELEHLHLASLLHDIGKIGISDEILFKPTELEEEEYSLVKRHVCMATVILHYTPSLQFTLPTILAHHERWDGIGYPNGLNTTQIPFLARMLSIVDAYDAMVYGRCYKQKECVEYAINEIEDNAGTQFDPELAPQFIEMILASSKS